MSGPASHFRDSKSLDPIDEAFDLLGRPSFVRQSGSVYAMTDSIFTRILRGELPAHKVWEDGAFFAFLDIRPIQPGHTLLVPKVQVDSIWDLDAETYAALWQRAHRLAGPICSAMKAVRTGVVVEGLAVPHVHVHLIPVNATADLDPNKGRAATDAELATVADALRAAIRGGADISA